jgi:simple sugar transport system ATP-binding protein
VSTGGAQPLLEVRGVTKSFGHVQALRGVDFTVYPQEVCALVGDNGAGKSTLVKILSGTLHPDGGEILFDGKRVTIASPVAARALGLETVYQDLALAPELDPAANLFLGREILRPGPFRFLGLLDGRAMRRRTDEAFTSLGVRLQNTGAPVANRTRGQRHGVPGGRARTWASRIVFMDEPTAALGVVQTRNVLDLIRRVRDSGLSVVLISHNLPEVLEVADRIEVLRLGRRVAQFTGAEASLDTIVSAMTGSLQPEEAA